MQSGKYSSVAQFLCIAFLVLASGTTSCIGVWLGPQLLKPYGEDPHHSDPGIMGAMASWDGYWYREIAIHGYSYNGVSQSSIAFYPAFPILAREIRNVLHVDINVALWLGSNLSLCVGAYCFNEYMKSKLEARSRRCGLLSLLFLPWCLFFHMAYSESLLFCLISLSILGMQRRWHPIVIAITVGSATATRAVGVALLPPLAFYVWTWLRDIRRTTAPGVLVGPQDHLFSRNGYPRYYVRCFRLIVYLCIGCWGLLSFIIYQYVILKSAFAFVEVQGTWHQRDASGVKECLVGFLILEPIHATYSSTSLCWWRLSPPQSLPLLNMTFMNPIIFIGTCMLVVLGARKRWLNRTELLLAIGLLTIPYCAQSCRLCMVSEARFASVVAPAYLVAGRLLSCLPTLILVYLCVLSAVGMTIYSAMFSCGYPVL